MLEIQHTDIGYLSDSPLLSGANGTLNPGEMIALAGENGSGKSTLLRCCAGLLKPVSGRILINDREVSQHNRHQLASILSLVTTVNYFYENLSVYELVALGRHPYTNWWGTLAKEDQRLVGEAIEFVGLNDYTHAPLARLSDGERQRAMIARALAQDTDILLLDEPMAFLDQPNRASVTRVLRNLRSTGKALIYSTHEVDSIFRYADKCWLLKDNSLLEGSPEDLALGGVFNDLYAEHGLRFDDKEIRFALQDQPVTRIDLRIGDPGKAMWTRRAIERSLTGKTGDSDDLKGIRVSDNDSGNGWKAETGNTTREFFTLYELTRYLTASK